MQSRLAALERRAGALAASGCLCPVGRWETIDLREGGEMPPPTACARCGRTRPRIVLRYDDECPMLAINAGTGVWKR